MNEQEKIKMHSTIFQGYAKEVPNRDVNDIPIYSSFNGYKFLVDLISMERGSSYIENKEKKILLSNFNINVLCFRAYKPGETIYVLDENLLKNLISSIHIGTLIEFRGTAYKRDQNRKLQIVVPHQIKTAKEIRIHECHIQIMPPNSESLKRYQTYIEEIKKKQGTEDDIAGNQD